MKCNLKDSFRERASVFGTWVTIGHPDIADILETLPFDFLVLDSEHAPLGPESLSSLIQVVDGARICPIVRVGTVEQAPVKSALDMGAHGVIFPLISSGTEAASAVRFSKYPPVGTRGVAPRKASEYGSKFAEYLRSANEMTTVVVQIETKEALGHLDEILSTKGVDVGFVGPTDLTMSLGLLDDRSNPRVIEAMKSVIAACDSNGVVPGVLAASVEEARRAVSLGFRFIALGSDSRFIVSGARSFLESVGRR